jgi:hypothetical protein
MPTFQNPRRDGGQTSCRWRNGTEDYDLVVEFQTARAVELAIFIIHGCTHSAQYNRSEFPRDDTGRT